MLRLAYSLLLFSAIPLILLRLLWRGFNQRGYWEHVGERLGLYPQPPLTSCIWIHAVSVGEMRAAQPLVQALHRQYPQYPVVLSCMTVTGRAVARELYADKLTCVYLPYDFLMLHRRLIAHFRPRLLLIMETEIWPNLIAACRTKNVPIALVNARLSENSQNGYKRFEPIRVLIWGALESIDVVGAQFPADAARFASLGARAPVVTGNIKFDVPVDNPMAARGHEWRTRLAPTKHILLAASTRDGEEALLLEAYRVQVSSDERRRILLVLVPRHPQRFDAVFKTVEESGFRAGRRSKVDPDDTLEIWLGDSMGEMAAYISMCDVAFIGGSLVPLGGQNLIEACAQGKPVVMGPSTFNFADAARLAIEAGALIEGNDANAVIEKARSLLLDDDLRGVASAAAMTFAAAHAGATQKTMGLIAPLLLDRK